MKKSSLFYYSLISRSQKLFSHCSLSCIYKVSSIVSWLIINTKNDLSVNTLNNIKLCFPAKNDKQQQKLVTKSIQQTVHSFFELSFIWHKSTQIVFDSIDLSNVNLDLLPHSKTIIIAPHYGSWELLNLWLADQYNLISLYKPAKSTSLDQYIFKSRTRTGANLQPTNASGLKYLLKGLKTNSNVMILPDQRPGKKTSKVDAAFFSNDASTSLLIKRLIKMTNADVVIAGMQRDNKNIKFNLLINTLDKNLFLQDDIESALYLNKSIENFIKNDLSQYQWSYRRFNKSLYKSLK